MTLPVTGRVFEVFRDRDDSKLFALVALAPLQSPTLPADGKRPSLVDSPCAEAHHPLVDIPSSVHSHTMSPPCFGSEMPIPEITFRPRGFAPPRRFAPLEGRRLVASCYRPGVRRVSRDPKLLRPKSKVSTEPVPRDAVRTPRRIPLAGSRTASPRSLPSFRCDRDSNYCPSHARFQALAEAGIPARRSNSRPCSTTESVASSDRCQSNDALSFRGLCSPSRSS
jgi:hypothetical protein